VFGCFNISLYLSGEFSEIRFLCFVLKSAVIFYLRSNAKYCVKFEVFVVVMMMIIFLGFGYVWIGW
jgi:hypothetical protein